MDEKKLYLVFELLFMDLKQYIDEQKYRWLYLYQKNRIDVELSRSYMYQMLQVFFLIFIKCGASLGCCRLYTAATTIIFYF